MECRRRDLAILASLAVVFFVYFNFRSLHAVSQSNFRDFFQASTSAEGGGDGYDNGPANSTLGVSEAIPSHAPSNWTVTDKQSNSLEPLWPYRRETRIDGKA